MQSAASRERGRALLAGVSGLKRRAERRAWASWRDAVGRIVWCMFDVIYMIVPNVVTRPPALQPAQRFHHKRENL